MMPDRFVDMTEFTIHWNQDLGDIDLAIPKAYSQDVAVGIAGDRWDTRYQLYITGIAYGVTTGVGPLGVQLVQTCPGTPTRIIWEMVSAAVGHQDGGFRCKWALSPPGVSSPASNPGRLSVVRVGSVVTASLTITFGFLPAQGDFDHFATPPFQMP